MQTNNADLPEYLQNVLIELEGIKKQVHALAITLLLEGELKPPPNSALGESYPYDLNLYLTNSVDPNVQALSSLLENVEKTIINIKTNL